MTGGMWLAAARQMPKIPADWLGWVVVIVLVLVLGRALLKALRIL